MHSAQFGIRLFLLDLKERVFGDEVLDFVGLDEPLYFVQLPLQFRIVNPQLPDIVFVVHKLVVRLRLGHGEYLAEFLDLLVV